MDKKKPKTLSDACRAQGFATILTSALLMLEAIVNRNVISGIIGGGILGLAALIYHVASMMKVEEERITRSIAQLEVMERTIKEMLVEPISRLKKGEDCAQRPDEVQN